MEEWLGGGRLSDALEPDERKFFKFSEPVEAVRR